MPEIPTIPDAEVTSNPHQAEQLRCIRRIRELQKSIQEDIAGVENGVLRNQLQQAYADLYTSVRPLVRSIIKKNYNGSRDGSLSADDLEGDAALVLYSVVDGYDENIGDVGAYLSVAVRRKIMASILRNRLLSGSDGLQRELWEAQREFFQQHGQEPSDQQLIEGFGFTQSSLDDIRRAQRVLHPSSAGEADDVISLESSIPDSNGARPDAAMESSEEIAGILERLSVLPAGDAAIVRARLGINEDGSPNGESTAFMDIGKLLGLSAGIVRQRYLRGRRILQKNHSTGDPPEDLPQAFAGLHSPAPAAGNIPSSEIPNQTPSAYQVLPLPPSVLPPERTRHGAGFATALSRVSSSTQRKLLMMLHEKPNTTILVKDMAQAVWGETTPTKMSTAQSMIGWAREEIGSDYDHVGLIHPVRGERAYQLVTRSWERLEDIQDLVWQERMIFELFAEWERRPVRIEDIIRLRPSVASGKKEGIMTLVYDLRQKGRKIVTTNGGYLYNPHTNIPPQLLSMMTYPEYVLLSTMLQNGVGVPVSREVLSAAFTNANHQVGTKPLRCDAFPHALRLLKARLGEYGDFEKNMIRREQGIISCTLTRWSGSLERQEPDPVATEHEANVRRFAEFIRGYVYMYASESHIRDYFRTGDIVTLAADAQKILPAALQIVHTPNCGWSLVSETDSPSPTDSEFAVSKS